MSLDTSQMDGYFGKNHTSFLRLNHYPPCPSPESELGISPHFDAGLLTILKHDTQVSGLQVQKPSVPTLRFADLIWFTEGLELEWIEMMLIG